MRTTLNIDEALLADYKQIAARSHRSLSSVIQDALRESLLHRDERADVGRIKLPTFGHGGALPGVDLDDNVAHGGSSRSDAMRTAITTIDSQVLAEFKK